MAEYITSANAVLELSVYHHRLSVHSAVIKFQGRSPSALGNVPGNFFGRCPDILHTIWKSGNCFHLLKFSR